MPAGFVLLGAAPGGEAYSTAVINLIYHREHREDEEGKAPQLFLCALCVLCG
jgi:hypothetical protein